MGGSGGNLRSNQGNRGVRTGISQLGFICSVLRIGIVMAFLGKVRIEKQCRCTEPRGSSYRAWSEKNTPKLGCGELGGFI